jgi:hypothetical protein
MNTQIANKIDLVRNSFPSVFSKDDVVKLLEDLSNETASDVQDSVQNTAPSGFVKLDDVFSEDNIKILSGYMCDSLDGGGTDIIDDYDLSISGREVEIDSVTFNSYSLRKCIESAIDDFKDCIEEKFNVSE